MPCNHTQLTTDCSLLVQEAAQSDVNAAFGVRLSAPAGSKAARVIDRGFKATAVRVNGARVYVGVGDSSHSLWRDASGKWTIGQTSEKGQEGGIAHVTNGESPLSQSAEWRVHIPEGLYVKLTDGDDLEEINVDWGRRDANFGKTKDHWVTESRVSAQEFSEHELEEQVCHCVV